MFHVIKMTSLVVAVFIVLLSVQCSVWADGEHKSVGRAELYSWIVPGVGQLYVGDEERAAAFFVGWFVAADISNNWVIPLGVNVWAGFDAGKCANKHNDRLPNRGLALAPTVDPVGKGVGLAMIMKF